MTNKTEQTNPFQLFETNQNLESGAGVKIEYPGFSIVIHRAGGSNKKFTQVLSTKMKPYRHKFERGLLDDETANKIMIEAYAEAVVVGWEGVRDKNNELLPFTKENVVQLFNALPEFFQDVVKQAQQISNFKEENEKVDEKN